MGVAFIAGSYILDGVADAIDLHSPLLRVANPQNERLWYGFFYSLLKGASAGCNIAVVPAVVSGLSQKEESNTWLRMAVAAPFMGAIMGGLVSTPVTLAGSQAPLIGDTLGRLHSSHIDPKTAATVTLTGIALNTACKPQLYAIADRILRWIPGRRA